MNITGYLILIGWGTAAISILINIILSILLRKKREKRIVENNKKLIEKEVNKENIKLKIKEIVYENKDNDLNSLADDLIKLQDLTTGKD